MELALLAVSENLLPEIRRKPNLEVLGEPRELDYDAGGNLLSPLLEALAPTH